MNKRYFFRGLGCGLIIGALVMMVVLHAQDKNKTSTATPSDASQTSSSDVLGSDTETTESTTEATTESDTELKTGSTTEPADQPTTESKTEVTTESATEPSTDLTTEEITETTTEATTEETTEVTTEAEKGGSITVRAGMSAQSVARKLHNIGVIEDEEDFYMYMYNNGYASKILQGTFTFTGDEDYETIATILTSTR